MVWRVGLAAFLLLWASPVAARHGSVVLDARRASPGVQLELVELPLTAPQTSSTVKYRLRAEGVPRGVTLGVWTKNFGRPFQEVLSGFRMDEGGVLVSIDESGRPRRLDEIVLAPGPYPKGAVWEVALASVDRTLTAFAKVIPYPVTARDGACAVSLELISLRGDRFVASGGGFAPGEDVHIELRYSGRVAQKRQRVSAEGRLPSDVILHGAIGTDRSARYAVRGRSCELAVEYEWGEPALNRR